MTDTYAWTQMLDDFRQLGGIAENVEQRVGQYGNGLFPIDPAGPIAIEVPERLLVDVEQFILDGEDLIVKPDSVIPLDVRKFMARYQKHFSWGREGRKNVEAFEAALRTLPEVILSKLRQMRVLNLEIRHKGAWKDVIRQRFLQSRRINYRHAKVVMPIIELINHAPRSPGYIINEGIKVRGKFAGEVTVNYSPQSDPLVRFLTYGFANQEPQAYSLPLRWKTNTGDVFVVGGDFASSNKVDGLPIPKLDIENKRHRLSHLLLAAEKAPRVPKTIARKALSAMPVAAVDELFDRIRNANQLEMCNLLDLADGVDSDVCKELRRAVLFQMRALTHSYGVRS
jgi:hypothetical protein